MKHEIVWEAVDNLAKKNGLSPSGLAKKAGMDSTTFNKSKRQRKDGHKRWPSMHSISKLLDLFEITIDEFYQTENSSPQSQNSPIAKYSKLNLNTIINNNELDISSWEKFDIYENSGPNFSLEIDTNRFEPIYKYGSILVMNSKSQIRRNDRIMLINRFKEIGLYEFLGQKSSTIEVKNLNKNSNIEEIKNSDTILMYRILWASQ